MKKYIFLLLISNVYLGFSQTYIGARVSPFFTNGTILTGNYGNKTINTTQKDYNGAITPFNLGIFLNKSLSDKFSMQYEVNYSMQAFNNNNPPSANKIKDGFGIDYLEIPILLQYKKANFFINTGIALKINIGAGYFYNDDTARTETNAYNVFNPLVVSGKLGLGVISNINPKIKIIGEFRLGYDITQTAKRTNSIELSNGSNWYFNNSRMLHLALLNVGITYQLTDK